MRIYLFIACFLLSLAAKPQGFVVRHALPSVQRALSKAIFEVSPGNYIATGLVQDVGGFTQLSIMGLGAQGQQLWVKKYGQQIFEYLNSNLTTRSFYKQGNFMYYAGCAIDTVNVVSGVLIKFDMNGDTLWQKVYRDTADDVIPQMVTGSVDGGFLISGFFQNASYSECLLIKTDANGNELWRKKIGKVSPDVEDGKAIVQDSASKKIVVAGYQYIGNASVWNAYENIVILDSLGSLQSRHNYDQAYGYRGGLFDMIQTKDKKIVVAGAALLPQQLGGTNLSRGYLLKFDLDSPATPLWRIYNFDDMTLMNYFTCLVELPNGNLLVGGSYDTLQIHNLNPNDLTRFAKISPSGARLWKGYYNYKTNAANEQNIQMVVSVNLTSDNGWVAAIQDYANNGPLFYVKYDSTGCDTTQAYCQMIAAGLGKNYLNKTDIQIYPNPSSGLITVSIPNPEGQLSLSIEDVAGREVKQLTLNPALQEQGVDLGALSNGVYVLSLSKGKQVLYVKKIIKQN